MAKTHYSGYPVRPRNGNSWGETVYF